MNEIATQHFSFTAIHAVQMPHAAFCHTFELNSAHVRSLALVLYGDYE